MIVDSQLTVPELVARGLELGDAIAARAFGRWIEVAGPAGADGRAATTRVRDLAAERGLQVLELEAALVSYAAGNAGADRQLLELLGEPLE